MSELHSHGKVHGEVEVLGVTRDPILRPAGTLMVIVGAIWALFAGMAAEAGTFGQPLAAVSLIILGAIVAGVGTPGEDI